MKRNLKDIPGYVFIAILVIVAGIGFSINAMLAANPNTVTSSCFVTGNDPAKPSLDRLSEAENGNPGAQIDIGRYYQEKFESEQLKAKEDKNPDQELYFKQAVNWYIKAAKQQQRWAQGLLGDIYSKRGDLLKSYAWFLIYAGSSYDPKKRVCGGMNLLEQAMKRVEANLSTEEIATATKTAYDLRESLAK